MMTLNIFEKKHKKCDLDWPITHNINLYIQSQLKNDQPGLHDFRRFLVNFEPISLKFWKGHFLFESQQR